MTGALEIATAIQLRRYIPGEWMLILSGIASVVFGIFVMAVPLAGALAIALCVGVYTMFFGVLMVVLEFGSEHESDRSTWGRPFRCQPVRQGRWHP